MNELSNGIIVKNTASIMVAGIITTFYIWAYLSWTNISSYYGRDTWATFTAVSKGDGNLADNAKFATLIFLHVLGTFCVYYGVIQTYFLNESVRGPVTTAFGVVITFIALIATGFEWLST